LRRRLEVLDKLSEPHHFSHEGEVLLDRLIRGDGRRGIVGSVQVPGVEAREVLERAEELVAADWKEEGRVSMTASPKENCSKER
jgi:hypothetical protein